MSLTREFRTSVTFSLNVNPQMRTRAPLTFLSASISILISLRPIQRPIPSLIPAPGQDGLRTVPERLSFERQVVRIDADTMSSD